MTPKEKALELFDKFDRLLPSEGLTTGHTPIECAKIVIDEVISELDDFEKTYSGNINNSFNQDFWEEVKQEIDKL